MVSTFTTNKSLEKPATGDQVGTWGGVTVNPNMDKIDQSFGGLATIALTNSPVTLSSGQYVCTFIRFTGAITADVAITFPAVGSFYTIINDCTNSSNFVLTALTTAAGGRTIGLPPGTMTQIMTDGTNARFTTLPAVGTYWDYAGSSVPRWVSACTVAPWLYCNAGSFSSATYPALTALLGGTTLPDSRGRFRGTLNDGTGRITSGLDGNTTLAGGGAQTVTLSSVNIPNYNLTVTDPGHDHQEKITFSAGGNDGIARFAGNAATQSVSDCFTASATTGITVNSGGSGTAFSVIPPGYIGGITLIRAA